MKTKSLFAILSVFSLMTLIFYSCGSLSNKGIKENNDQQIEEPTVKNTSGYGKSFNDNDNKDILDKPIKAVIPIPNPEISKVIFFIENSGSMKGYVVGSPRYVDVLSNMANHPDLIKDNINKVFYLTSGISAPRRVTNLRQSLIPSNFNESRSDLNNLFKTALDSTKRNSVTILVSDGIYDMCPDPNPINTLTILGRDLRTVFIRKLQSSDFQTIVVKCKSSFNGRYFPGNCCTAYTINQDRPYFIWIFGETEVLKKYFTDEYLKNLNGYENSARFFKYKASSDIYKPNSHNKIGSYYPSKSNKNTLENVKSNSAGVFQFSIAVDFSELPLNEKYLTDKGNYSCSNGFEIVSIDTPTSVSKLGFPNQTHLIVVRKTGNPIGTLTVSLLNKGYPWISSTNISNDCNIRGNSNQTFGFEVLNQGIIEAYQNFNTADEICKFTIILKN